jgi:hypothetical protein
MRYRVDSVMAWLLMPPSGLCVASLAAATADEQRCPVNNLDAPTAPDRAVDEFGQDIMRGINPAPNRPEGSTFPSMLVRGGMVASGDHGEGAGVFALSALQSPVSVGPSGFRCVQ